MAVWVQFVAAPALLTPPLAATQGASVKLTAGVSNQVWQRVVLDHQHEANIRGGRCQDVVDGSDVIVLVLLNARARQRLVRRRCGTSPPAMLNSPLEANAAQSRSGRS